MYDGVSKNNNKIMYFTARLWSMFNICIFANTSKPTDYADGGKNWLEPTCDPEINKNVSPINIDRKSVICSSDYFIDLFVYKDPENLFILTYVGDPKTIRSRFTHKTVEIFVRFSNGNIIKYVGKEIVFRVPAEHTIDGVRAPGESQYLFVVDKKYKNYTDIHEIRVSFLLESLKNWNKPNFFKNIVEQLKKMPISQMAAATELNPIVYSAATPSALNQYFTRPIRFWSYDGTQSDGDCSKNALIVIFKEKLLVSEEDLHFYHTYLENISGINTNARTVINGNEITVRSCGDVCETSIRDFLVFLIVYPLVLYFTFVQI